jgi:hypothetical protein
MFLKLLALLACAGACCAQSSLTQYLSLTGAQRSTILFLNTSYNSDWVAQQLKLLDADNQLSDLALQPGTDPLLLGQLAVTAETIRRDRVAKQLTLQTQVAAVLMPAQATAVQNLLAFAVLAPLAADAACANLVSPSVPQLSFSNFPGFLLGMAVLDSIPTPTILDIPDIPPAPTGLFCGLAQFPISVREYLGLTDAQVANLFSASAAYNDFYARKQNRLTDIQFQIADLTALPATDSATLGLPYIEMSQIGQQIKDKLAQLRDSSLSQLSAAQTAQVKTLQTVQDFSNAGLFANAVGCNLLLLPAGSSKNPPGITGTYSSCFL